MPHDRIVDDKSWSPENAVTGDGLDLFNLFQSGGKVQGGKSFLSTAIQCLAVNATWAKDLDGHDQIIRK